MALDFAAREKYIEVGFLPTTPELCKWLKERIDNEEGLLSKLEDFLSTTHERACSCANQPLSDVGREVRRVKFFHQVALARELVESKLLLMYLLIKPPPSDALQWLEGEINAVLTAVNAVGSEVATTCRCHLPTVGELAKIFYPFYHPEVKKFSQNFNLADQVRFHVRILSMSREERDRLCERKPVPRDHISDEDQAEDEQATTAATAATTAATTAAVEEEESERAKEKEKEKEKEGEEEVDKRRKSSRLCNLNNEEEKKKNKKNIDKNKEAGTLLSALLSQPPLSMAELSQQPYVGQGQWPSGSENIALSNSALPNMSVVMGQQQQSLPPAPAPAPAPPPLVFDKQSALVAASDVFTKAFDATLATGSQASAPAVAEEGTFLRAPAPAQSVPAKNFLLRFANPTAFSSSSFALGQPQSMQQASMSTECVVSASSPSTAYLIPSSSVLFPPVCQAATLLTTDQVACMVPTGEELTSLDCATAAPLPQEECKIASPKKSKKKRPARKTRAFAGSKRKKTESASKEAEVQGGNRTCSMETATAEVLSAVLSLNNLSA